MAKVNYQINSSIPDFKNFLGIVLILIIAFILNSRIENLQGGTALSLSCGLELPLVQFCKEVDFVFIA